jgi:hypothetical protein
MTIDPELLHTWSCELCRRAALDPSEVGVVFGLPGTVIERGRDYLVLEPPPAGTKRVTIGRHNGALLHVSFDLVDGTMTRADLERRFGPGNAIPRVDVGRPHRLMFPVEIAGTPFSCALFASFVEPPTAASVAMAVMLRRDPGR